MSAMVPVGQEQTPRQKRRAKGVATIGEGVVRICHGEHPTRKLANQIAKIRPELDEFTEPNMYNMMRRYFAITCWHKMIPSRADQRAHFRLVAKQYGAAQEVLNWICELSQETAVLPRQEPGPFMAGDPVQAMA